MNQLEALLAKLADDTRPRGFRGSWRHIALKIPSLRQAVGRITHRDNTTCRAARRDEWRASWAGAGFGKRKYRRQAWKRSWQASNAG